MTGRKRALRWLAMLFGSAGVLLCVGAVFGLILVKDRAFAATETARSAVDDLMAGVQEGVAAAGPEVAALRGRLAERVSEELVADLRADLVGARRFLDHVARTGEAAAAIFESLDDRPVSETLRGHVEELRDAARALSEFRFEIGAAPRPRPVLAKIESLLADLHRDLTTLRMLVSVAHSDVNYAIGKVLLLAAVFFLWMGVGQWSLSRTGRETPNGV